MSRRGCLRGLTGASVVGAMSSTRAAAATLTGRPGTGPPGTIATVAGGGLKPGQVADGGPAVDAFLIEPVSVAVDAAGNLYLGEAGTSSVRKVTPDGTISTIAGPEVLERAPVGLAADDAGNVYFADQTNRVYNVSPEGIVSTIAGTGSRLASGDGGAASTAGMAPDGLAVDPARNLYIADTTNFRVRKVSPDGVITTVVGTGVQGFSGDDGPASQAQIGEVTAIAVDRGGQLYIADKGNGRIRRVTPGGVIRTIAGNGSRVFGGDGGSALAAGLETQYGIAADGSGNVYYSDLHRFRVRRIAPNGVITTIAGDVKPGYAGDGGPATNARLFNPVGLIVDGNGTLYIADFRNNRVRAVYGAGR